MISLMKMVLGGKSDSMDLSMDGYQQSSLMQDATTMGSSLPMAKLPRM